MLPIRKGLPFGLLLLLVWTGLAFGTVRISKVDFRHLASPTPFKTGISQHLELEMLVRRPAVVTDIQLSGRNWTVSAVKLTLREIRDLHEIYRLEFDLSATDTGQPLEFTYRLDGQPASHTIDFSDEALLGRKTQGGVESVPASEYQIYQTKGATNARIDPAPVEPRHLIDPEGTNPATLGDEPTKAKSARIIEITGEFGYNMGHAWRPAYGAKVVAFASGLGMSRSTARLPWVQPGGSIPLTPTST